MEHAHIVMIGLLVVILIVIVMARNRVRDDVDAIRKRRQAIAAMAQKSLGNLGALKRKFGSEIDDLRAGMIHSQPSLPLDDGSGDGGSSSETENFRWTDIPFYDVMRQQAEQKKDLRDRSFPLKTVFAKLGTMAQSCEHDSSPQCAAFRNFAYALEHPLHPRHNQ